MKVVLLVDFGEKKTTVVVLLFTGKEAIIS
jgi:hypothetical protein